MTSEEIQLTLPQLEKLHKIAEKRGITISELLDIIILEEIS